MNIWILVVSKTFLLENAVIVLKLFNIVDELVANSYSMLTAWVVFMVQQCHLSHKLDKWDLEWCVESR